MKAILKILAVIYLVCIVFRARSHYTILGLEQRAAQISQRQAAAQRRRTRNLLTMPTRGSTISKSDDEWRDKQEQVNG